MPNLHHFYHVYADGDWKMCLPNHVRALKQYGLYDKLTSFNVGFVGKVENIQEILDYLLTVSDTDWDKVCLETVREIISYDENNSQFVETLKSLRAEW